METLSPPIKPPKVYTAKLYKLQTLREMELPENMHLCDTPEKAAGYWFHAVATEANYNGEVESFAVLFLNSRRRCTGHVVGATGTLDTLLIHPREVFRAAIVANASAIVLMHCHPSGETTPSEADIKVTRDMIRAGQLLKLDVLDHVIVGNRQENKYSSLRELGYFYAS